MSILQLAIIMIISSNDSSNNSIHGQSGTKFNFSCPSNDTAGEMLCAFNLDEKQFNEPISQQPFLRNCRVSNYPFLKDSQSDSDSVAESDDRSQ